MEKKHIITIAGKPGSGKSTASKSVAKRLDYQHFSSGDFFRTIGQERGVDVLKANHLAEKDKEIDFLVDAKLRTLGQENDKMVIDSRMAWHWMPYSFRVYLDLDLTIAAERILESMDDARLVAESIPASVAEYTATLQQRLDSEIKRYRSLYNVNPYDTANYDLVIDTALHGPEEVQLIVTERFLNWLT